MNIGTRKHLCSNFQIYRVFFTLKCYAHIEVHLETWEKLVIATHQLIYRKCIIKISGKIKISYKLFCKLFFLDVHTRHICIKKKKKRNKKLKTEGGSFCTWKFNSLCCLLLCSFVLLLKFDMTWQLSKEILPMYRNFRILLLHFVTYIYIYILSA